MGINMKKDKKISDQDALTLASDYTITSYGLKEPHLPDSIVILDINGNEIIVENPTEDDLANAVQRNLTNKFGDTYTIIDSIHDPATGLDGVLLYNNETNSHIVVFQGSQTSYDAVDWLKTNPALANNEVDPQHLQALKTVEAWMQKYNVEGVSGNSLAGGLVQFLIMANPDLWGRTINPAGVNQAMVDYIKAHYGITDEQLNNVDLINFYTRADVLHRLLGLQTETGVQSKNEHFQDLYQIGMQLMLENAGDFSLENMAIEHTGHNRVTIYGPFDPLTGDFMKGVRTIGENGKVHYTVSSSTEIELNPEELTQMACKLANSLDAHADEMARLFDQIEGLLDYSAGEIDARSGAIVNLVEEAIRNSEFGWHEKAVLQALNSPLTLSTFLYVAPGWATMSKVNLNVQDAGVLWIEQFAIRRWLDEVINTFLENCGLQNKSQIKNETVHYSAGVYQGQYRQAGYSVIRKQYFENSYFDAPMEEAFRSFMTKCVADSKKTIIAMDYYAEAMLHAAEVFAVADANASKLLADISETRQRTANSGTRQTLKELSHPDFPLTIEYDNNCFMNGLNERKRELMDNNFYLFKNFFSRVVSEVKVNIIPQLLAFIERNRKASEYRSFDHYIEERAYEFATGREIDDDRKEMYRSHYNEYNQSVTEYNAGIDEYLATVNRLNIVLETLAIEEVLPNQFKEQILQLLFKDNQLYDFIQYCQRLSAHHSVGAQLVAQTTANVNYNTGTAIDSLVDIGRKVQDMLETGESHLMRVRV